MLDYIGPAYVQAFGDEAGDLVLELICSLVQERCFLLTVCVHENCLCLICYQVYGGDGAVAIILSK